MNALGIDLRVPKQLGVVISISCSGPEQMDAHGMKIRVTSMRSTGQAANEK